MNFNYFSHFFLVIGIKIFIVKCVRDCRVAAHVIRLAPPFVRTSENVEVAFCVSRRHRIRLASYFYVAFQVVDAIHT